MGMNYQQDTPHSLYNEFVQVENEIEAIGRRVKQLGIDAINADANYEQAKNQTLIRLFAEEAGDDKADPPVKPFKRTEAQREAIYRTEHANLRLTRNLAKNNLEAEKTLLKALADKLNAIQSRKGIMLMDHDKFGGDGRIVNVDKATGNFSMVPDPRAIAAHQQPPAPAPYVAPKGVDPFAPAPVVDIEPEQQPATGGELTYDFNVDTRTPESVMRQTDEEMAAAALPVPQAVMQEAFPGEPQAELKEIYGRKDANPWDDESPIAKNLHELVTAKQLGMIRALAREARVDADEECNDKFGCRTDELTKKAASGLIKHLEELPTYRAERSPLRRAL